MKEDDGAATVLAAFALAAILVVAVMIIHLGGAVGARHQAQSAADLAALGAASALDGGVADACDVADQVATRMGVDVSSCEVDQWDVVVAVRKSVLLGRFGMPDAVAVARAGP